MTTRIQIITFSTRPGRVGPAVASWLVGAARAAGIGEIEPIDLADFQLPVFDEPRHPRLQQYEHEHTRRWSASVSRADAFVFVTPEYNFGPPPSLVNALNYLNKEWHYKPVAIASYGGVSGGMRSAEGAKHLAMSLRMVPVVDAVVVPNVHQQLGPDGFTPNPHQNDSVAPMLRELDRVAQALKPLR